LPRKDHHREEENDAHGAKGADLTSTAITRATALSLLAFGLATVGTLPLSRSPRQLSTAAEALAEETSPGWETSVDAIDQALATCNISGAEIAWRNGYGAAIRSRQWEGLLALGEASLRIADCVHLRQPYRARAREVWRDALFRARKQRSVDGVLKITEAFATLGDTDAVIQALRIADRLAADDATGDARRRVAATREHVLPAARTGGLADPLLLLFPDAAVGP